MRSPIVLAVAAAGLFWSTGGMAADATQEWSFCNGTAVGGVSSEAQIAGCTARIESGAEQAGNLYAAYYNRGLAYYLRGDYDLAITDFDAAIALKSEADAFIGRGLAHFHLNHFNRA